MTHGSIFMLRRVFALLLATSASFAMAAPSAPVLTSLATTTTSNPETVTGTATVGTEVRLYVNGTLMELATVQPDGSFSTKIPLYDGSNSVHAKAWDGLEESAASNTLTSTYTNTLPRNQSGTISVDTVWTPAGGAYVITNNLTIASGVEFRLMPGVEVRVDNAKLIDVNGVMVVSGTSASTVAIRSSSASPTKTSWAGLRINNSGYVDFDYALVEHATNAMQFLGGEGAVKHTTLRNSSTGVNVQANSSPSFTQAFEISGNHYGVVVTGNNIEAQNPLPVFTGGTIRDSYYSNYQTGSFGNGGSVVLNATGNWWGSTDLAVIASKIVDNSDQIALPTVDFSSYLGAQGGTPVHGGSFLFGPVNADRTLPAGDYLLLGNVRIATGVTLTVQPGTIVRAPPGTYGTFQIEVNGTLVAHGTAPAPITFRSGAVSPTKGSWVGLRVTNSGFVDLDYVVVEHANNALSFEGGEGTIKHTTLRNSNYGVNVLANSSPSFTEGFEISGNNYGVVVTGNNIEAQNPSPVFAGGTIKDSYYSNYQTQSFGNGAAVVLNASSNWWGSTDVAVIASKIIDNSDQTLLPTVDFSAYLNAQGGTPAHTGSFLFGPVNANRTLAAADYQMLGNIRIAAGVTLTVQPGATLRAPPGTYGTFQIEVNGTLMAQGTAAAPITFRSGAAVPGKYSWTGIRITNSGYVDFDYAVVEHATNAMDFAGGEGVIKRTTLRTSGTGVNVQANSSPSFTQGFEISGNNAGVAVTGNNIEAQNPLPVFTGGTIKDNYNSNYSAQSFGNGSAVVLNATNNWWGSADVAVIASRITDNSDIATLPTVDFGGYLNAQGGTPAHSGSFLSGPVNSNRTIAPGDYQLLGNLRVASGVTLTLEPGVTIRVPSTYNFVIEVNGTLHAHGTAAAPIVFRSSKAPPAKADWTGVRVTNSGYVDLDYVVVEHARYALHFTGGEGVIRHTTLRTSLQGAWIQASSSPQFSDGYEITGNDAGVNITGDGVAANDPRPSFVGGAIHNNVASNGNVSNVSASVYGNPAGVTIDAKGNWWGSTDIDYIRARITDRFDSPSFPALDILDYLEAKGGLPYVGAYDITFPRRDADLVAGLPMRTEFVLNTASDAVLEIRNEDTGEIVRSVAVPNLSRGPNSLEWDGRKSDGTAAPDALYRVIPRLSKDARSWSLDPEVPFPESLWGDAYGYVPERFNPYRNEFWKMEYFHCTAWPAMVTVTATPPGGGTPVKLPTRVMDAGAGCQAPFRAWYYWDGRNAQGQLVDGTWEIYFHWPTKPRPHYVRVVNSSPVITGTKAAPAVEVRADPYLIVHSYEQLARVAFRVSLESVVTVKLLPPGIVDPSSPQAIVLMNGQTLAAKNGQGNPIDHTIEWRGHETGDINRVRTTAEGVYTYSIEARSVQTQGSTLYRGVLQLYQ